jgi:hypothetical protein
VAPVGVLSRLGLAVVVLVATGLAPAASQSPPRNEYRGRVVEAGTGRPIDAAGVFLVWPSADETASPPAYREAQTDTQGQFSIDATTLEQGRLQPPQLWVYKPGYQLYPDRDVRPAGASAVALTQPSGTIRLLGARTDAERVEALNDFVAVVNRFAPTAGPILLGLIEGEFTRLKALKPDAVASTPAPPPHPGAAGPCDVDPKNPPPLPPPRPPRVPEPGTYNPFEGRLAPYYGKVVDAESGAPLVGAVVVAVWTRRVVYPFHSNSVFHDACEVLTDTSGRFVVDARRIEANPPRGFEPPTFVVFFPGYNAHGALGARVTSGTPFLRGDVQAFHDVSVGLVRLATREERLSVIGAVRPAEVPATKIRNLTRLVNVEAAALGVGQIPLTENEK